mmetsp:Transcript_29109/g.32667  ORF Transcript_29109/g.32667 Transcript_29109/m.32667 type:complete len:351 (+) Transcript_29109:169-1221(+)
MVNTFNAQIFFFCTTIAILLVVVVSTISNDNRNFDTSSNNDDERNSRFLQQVDQLLDNNKKTIQIQNTPKEINVDPRSTYNEKFMALMSSPCRPEKDGFFGATSGEPTRIQYGFQFEVKPFSVIMDILDVIEDKIVDSILMNTFPKMCGLRRTRRVEESPLEIFHGGKDDPSIQIGGGHPSGFRFFRFEEIATCLSRIDTVNFCSVFSGVVYLYGKHQHGDDASLAVMTHINQVFNTSVPSELHSDLALIFGVDEYSTIDNNMIHSSIPKETINNDVVGLSRLDILLIIISSLIILAITYYFFIQWSERKYDDSKSFASDSYLTDNITLKNQEDDCIEDEYIDDDLFEPY